MERSFIAVHTRTLAAFTKITSATPVLTRPRDVKWCITNWRLDGNIRVYHLLKAGLSQFRRVICHVRESECRTSLRYSSILGVAEIGRRL